MGPSGSDLVNLIRALIKKGPESTLALLAMCEDRAKRWSSMNQATGPEQTTDLPPPGSWTPQVPGE